MLKTVSSITNAIGALNYKGTWNASTNTPALASGVGTKGDYYVVSVAGTTSLDGISTWNVGDWATFNGSVWQRVEGGVDDPAPSLKSNSTTGLMQITGPAAASTRVMTIPDANFTVARTDAGQTFAGTQVFSGTIDAANEIVARGGVVTLGDVYPGIDDNGWNIGKAAYRWSVVYAATGTINTSDGNQKQQVADLTAQEKAVAASIKSLIKTFKFNDTVALKGDGARIHVGVIAQDVQAAFEAQGLDAHRYGMFCSDTWYEVDGKAQNGAGDFYTQDTPGAVEVTRLGVRYDQLLAFVIAAL